MWTVYQKPKSITFNEGEGEGVWLHVTAIAKAAHPDNATSEKNEYSWKM